jgi:methyltransferase (TIGR00027 family)
MANPVSRTAYYCAGVRMLDAQSKRPVVGDTFAERFMGEEGKTIFEPFRNERLPNGSNVARCHLIDEIARAHLKAHPGGLVVLVGAGFDSRAFRLPGGRWVEVDEAPVIARKEEVAPQASCPNELARISIDFASEKLADKLAAYTTGDAVLVIVEGVLVYLEESQIAELAGALAALFPQHTLACDMSSRAFHERTQDSPTQLGLMPIPRFGARFFLPKVIREGLSICVFERG